MSEARRTAQALEAACESAHGAATAAGKHSHRGRNSSWPQHITGLRELTRTLEALHYLTTRELAAVVKSCTHDLRTHYITGTTPEDTPWPDAIRTAAIDAEEMLSGLQSHLEKTPATNSHAALTVLRTLIRNLHQRNKSTT